MNALLLLLQVATTGAPVTLGDISGSYCLETGYCRPQNDTYPAPAPGVLFLATGLVGFGLVRLRGSRNGRC